MSKSDPHAGKKTAITKQMLLSPTSDPTGPGSATDQMATLITEAIGLIREARDFLAVRRFPVRYLTAHDAARVQQISVRLLRQWCREGRIVARKRRTRDGKSVEWLISETEIERIRRRGIRPLEGE